MKITVKCTPKEVADFVLQLQSQQLIKVSSDFGNFIYPFVVEQNKKMQNIKRFY